jgi:hypothetical protein
MAGFQMVTAPAAPAAAADWREEIRAAQSPMSGAEGEVMVLLVALVVGIL